jgi:hypothetical protein
MKLLEFMSNFSDEERCKEYYRDIRQKEGIICKKCGCEKHYWLQNKWQFQCSSCKFRTTLKSGTVMEKFKAFISKMVFDYVLDECNKKRFFSL